MFEGTVDRDVKRVATRLGVCVSSELIALTCGRDRHMAVL